ncbi:hypothetical protein COU78_06730 [Candidatus Peregrinibacteria bacterium CG10_big_fil_rev_8_21_14_0_10_49_24]|nr:MAG: hypothetical protein COU78_06730 [Candidatus Peregrinibacteria bacterium CG10_big_fil_rev_8_21_14_0_10_49_24]PJA67474.1 MAG: hypothetical protein CO157_03520 [Candidatus Peregrinibacteria bacterium CG_4_9_14_3_um_filter_49_12]
MQQRASVMGEVLASNETLRAFFVQAANLLYPSGTRLDGMDRARERWEQGLERYADAAKDPAIAGLLDEFITSANAILQGKDKDS